MFEDIEEMILKQKFERCVMCGEIALYLGRPTNEPLCVRCNEINEWIIRSRK